MGIRMKKMMVILMAALLTMAMTVGACADQGAVQRVWNGSLTNIKAGEYVGLSVPADWYHEETAAGNAGGSIHRLIPVSETGVHIIFYEMDMQILTVPFEEMVRDHLTELNAHLDQLCMESAGASSVRIEHGWVGNIPVAVWTGKTGLTGGLGQYSAGIEFLTGEFSFSLKCSMAANQYTQQDVETLLVKLAEQMTVNHAAVRN